MGSHMLGYDIVSKQQQADKKGHTYCGRGGKTCGLEGQEGYRMPSWQEGEAGLRMQVHRMTGNNSFCKLGDF